MVLSTLFDTFDPFTPHLHLLSLGGIRVHEGAWTALEVMQTLASHQGEDLILCQQLESRLYAQFNGLRLTWESSLLGLSHAHIACIFIDARYRSDWIERSVQRAIDELYIWHKSKKRHKEFRDLKVILWLELPRNQQEKNRLNRSLTQALVQLNRTLDLLNIEVLQSIESQCLSNASSTHEMAQQVDELEALWSKLYFPLSSDEIAQEIELVEETDQVDYPDAFVLVPLGTFYQGGPRLAPSSEKPRHQVKISQSFWVSQTPITQRFWSRVMDTQLDLRPEEHGNEPMVNVSWFDAVRFCNRLSLRERLEPTYSIENNTLPKVELKSRATGYRLLTESEWEYMALGGISTSLTAAPPKVSVAWTQERSTLKAHPVAQLDPNPWGLYDCLGNVAEWCQDVYQKGIYEERKKQRLSIDPCVYNGSEGERVVRGGAFDRPAYLVNHHHRESYHPKESWSSVGFRVMRVDFDLES